MLWDFTTVQSPADASVVAKELCDHHIITNSTLCDMVDIQRRLVDIINSTDPVEILCQDNTTVLVYDSEQVKDRVKSEMCNLTRDQQELLLMTIVDHLNLTAVRELYFPDGFNPLIVLELAENLQELMNMPSVQVSCLSALIYVMMPEVFRNVPVVAEFGL